MTTASSSSSRARSCAGRVGFVTSMCSMPHSATLVEEVADQDLEMIRPESAEAVTVEVFARWVHDQLSGAIRDAGGEVLGVRVWESPSSFGGYRAPVA